MGRRISYGIASIWRDMVSVPSAAVQTSASLNHLWPQACVDGIMTISRLHPNEQLAVTTMCHLRRPKCFAVSYNCCQHHTASVLVINSALTISAGPKAQIGRAAAKQAAPQ